MKLQSINLTNPIKSKQTSQVSFSGYKNDYGSEGQEVIKFFAPPGGKDIALEYVLLQKNGEHWVKIGDSDSEQMDSKEPLLVPKEFLPNDPDKAFGYRFIIDGKTVNDPGIKSQEGFNVLLSNAGGVAKTGPMYHIFPDSYYNPDWKGKDPQDVLKVRNHYNIAGGNIKGMIEKAKDGSLDPYGLIISTPLFGKDEISSHGYWTTNPYQISSLRGSLQDFKDLNIELFKQGKQLVADGAFTSQSFQSPLLQHALKWGKQSPYYNWFKFDYTGNEYSAKVALGVLPDTKAGLANSRYKLVNASSKEDGRPNPDYNPSKPTYIQFYDKRLASEEQAQDKANLITVYENKTADDAYDISTHQNSILPYSFEISPGDAKKLSLLKKFEDKPISDIENFEELFSFDHFAIAQKSANGGATYWDGNLDLVKMNLVNPNITSANNTGSAQAKNYLYSVATHWTKTVHNTLLESLALNKGELKTIADKNGISASDLTEIENNVASGAYQNNLFKDASNNATSFIFSEIMDFPLESIEVAPDLSAVLTSPFITPQAANVRQADVKKVDLVENLDKGMQEIYTKTVPDFVISVLKKMDEGTADEKKIFKGNDLTQYGQFIARLITPELTQFAFVRGITGKEGVVTAGGIQYDNLTQYNIYNVEVVADKQEGPEGEAKKLSKELTKNMADLNSSVSTLAQMFSTKYAQVTLKDFGVSQAVIEKAGAGLNWRFDAAKDVADLSSTLSNAGTNTFETSIDNMIDFWTPFISRIKEQNPNSMSIAEITDFWDIFRATNEVSLGKYADPNKAEQIFYEKTGATTGSNYSQFFSPLPEIYGQNVEHGSNYRYNDKGEANSYRVSWLYSSVQEFLSQNQLPFITNNHIFTDNHDKPRTLHGMALDMGLFLSDTQDESSIQKLDAHAGGNGEARAEKQKKFEEAKQLIKEIFKNTNVDTGAVSTKGIAVAKLYRDHAADFGCSEEDIDKAVVDIITKGGTIKDGTELRDRSKAFGTRPLEITIKDISERLGIDRAQEQKALDSIMKTALEKFKSMWEVMISLGGVPTMFNGEEYGQTGHETPSKNQELGCRNIVLHNRENNSSEFSKFYKKITATSGLHNLPGLSALSGGAPTLLDQKDNGTLAIYKYDDKGSEVISVMADVGVDRTDLQRPLSEIQKEVDAVLLYETQAEGTFRRKIWDEKKNQYIDEGINYIAKDGVLKDSLNAKIQLNGGANIFYKVSSGDVSFTGNPHVKLHNTKYAIPV